jgi:hypothetical protein
MIVVGCKQKLYKPTEYMNYFITENNITTRNIDFHTVRYKITFLTPEYYALSSFSGNDTLSEQTWQQKLAATKGNVYFMIDIFSNLADTKDPMEKAQIVAYYQTAIKNQLTLSVDNGSPFPPEYVNYEDNFGMAPYNRLFACFRLDFTTLKKNICVQYNDRHYGNRNVLATYSRADLDKLPILKF